LIQIDARYVLTSARDNDEENDEKDDDDDDLDNAFQEDLKAPKRHHPE
jgi:hypothetical protein